MVKVLFEKETIFSDEVQLLFEGKSAEEVIEYSKTRDVNLYNSSKKDSAPRKEVDKKVEVKEEKTPDTTETKTSKEAETPSIDNKEDDAITATPVIENIEDKTDKKEEDNKEEK